VQQINWAAVATVVASLMTLVVLTVWLERRPRCLSLHSHTTARVVIPARVLLLAAIAVLLIGAAARSPEPSQKQQTHGARENPGATGDRGLNKEPLPATGTSQTPAPDGTSSKAGNQGRAGPTPDGWITAIATVVIAIFAVVQGVALFRQARSMQQGLALTRQAADAATTSAAASARSVEIARQELVDVQRAYMFVKAFHTDAVLEQGRVVRWRIVTQWENYGQTPAVDVRLASVYRKIPPQEFEFPTAADFADVADAPTTPIAPRSGIDSTPIFITVAEAGALGKGDLTMVIGGRVQYRDILTGTQRHTEICARIVMDPEMAGKSHPFRFPGHPKNNSYT
jgi:hypothetical protein